MKPLNVRQACEYFGCSPNLLLKLKRWGWLKPIELERIPFHKTHYHKHQLDTLAWDYFYSLSMYDILFIKMNETASVQALARYRGLPRLVVELVRESETSAYVIELIRHHGRYRKFETEKLGHDFIPWGPSIVALARYAKKILDGPRGARKHKETPRDKRSWAINALPSHGLEISPENVYGRRSALTPISSTALAIAHNLNRHLPAIEQIKLPRSKPSRTT